MTPRPSNRRPRESGRLAERRSHQVRIVGGRLKRRLLDVLDRPGLRPTPDRVRETLFNWLGQDLSGWTCTDAFAGTGALGLEAVSRGAALVTLIERDAELYRHLKLTVASLGLDEVHVVHGDALDHLSRPNAKRQDIVFLDPPFDQGLFEPALHGARRVVKPDGWVYLESPLQWGDSALTAVGLRVHRYLKAGRVHAHLLQPVLNETPT